MKDSSEDEIKRARRTVWWDDPNCDPRADIEAVFSQYESSDAPAFLKSTMRRFRIELLGEDPVEIDGTQ